MRTYYKFFLLYIFFKAEVHTYKQSYIECFASKAARFYSHVTFNNVSECIGCHSQNINEIENSKEKKLMTLNNAFKKCASPDDQKTLNHIL